MLPSRRAPGYCIILAAGAGTRMRSPETPKVCFPIDGIPAINRAIAAYRQSGIRQPILVVGASAEVVMQTISREFSGILYAYQPDQLGTANAARVGAEALKNIGGQEDVLVVAGDRLVQPSVLEQLFDQFYSQEADLAFLTGPNPNEGEPAGRVLFHPDGSLLGNVEARDLHQRQILYELREHALRQNPLQREEMIARIQAHFNGHKAAAAFGNLWQALAVEDRTPTREEFLTWFPEEKTFFTFPRRDEPPFTLSPQEVDHSQTANLSVYLVKVSRLEYVLAHLNRDNAQGEEYLSDMISIAAAERWRTVPMYIADPDLVMGFNTPEELHAIEVALSAQKPSASLQSPLRSVAEWQQVFQGVKPGDGLHSELVRLYGENIGFLQDRQAGWQRLLAQAALLWGEDAQTALVRAPGRINLMGRHVDHQGGNCNLMTANRELTALLHPRQDDLITLFNLNPQSYPPRQFSIGQLAEQFPQANWLDVVNSPAAAELNRDAAGDWVQYVRAAALRLQKAFPKTPLRGIDLLVDGSIPPAAGLSSSSTLVVTAAEALLYANQIQLSPEMLVNLCGEGEWFVGTRGGSADHAAIKLGERGKLLKVKFFNFAVEGSVPFPDNLLLAVCDSGIQAKKTAGARDLFNHRVACYRLGYKLIRQTFPQYAGRLHHLRDVTADNLEVSLNEIYRILLSLPENASREELAALLPDEDLRPIFAAHAPPSEGNYPLRGVVLYGLAECERSRLFADALQNRDLGRIGRMMNTSHDGDRVMRYTWDGQYASYQSPTSDSYLLGLIADLESGEPSRVARARLECQPGSYRCSIPDIDLMVDLALGMGGVIGAQLAGAGLGGSMMVLARKGAAKNLRQQLVEGYYQPVRRKPGIFFCEPTAGSGVLFFQPKYESSSAIKEK